MLSNTLRLFENCSYFSSTLSAKNNRIYLKSKQKNKCFNILEIIWLILKMEMKIKINSHRYSINRPRFKHRHKYKKKQKVSHYDDAYIY